MKLGLFCLLFTIAFANQIGGKDSLCDFENGLCQWSVEGGDWYKWEHYNAKNLAVDDFAGPESDYQGHDDKYFIIAHLTDNQYSGDQNVLTKIKSPLFEVNQHPVECSAFTTSLM